ncbi:MAG: hypothetical protein EPN30_06060 [Actinomycetota bacterium]|nr:MAG: hypothetical protein EPN30_06060 [Actinomycetota bacterium]
MSVADLFEKIPGQDRLGRELQAHLGNLKNSYFFLGPQDAGVMEAAKAFAKSIMCSEGGCGTCRSCMAIDLDMHPDVGLYERSGAFLLVDEAREIVDLAYKSTSGSKYRIIIVPELELVGKAAPTLLKSVEEPPQSTIFLLLASMEVPELRTLISRSVVVRFDPLSEEQIFTHLRKLGYPDADSTIAVRLSAGRWSRAIALAGDQELRESCLLWEQLPGLLQREMSVVIDLVNRLLGVVALVEDRRRKEQKQEISRVVEMAKATGDLRETLVKKLEEKHHRELRRIRTAELRSGLLLLERFYRDQIVASDLAADKIQFGLKAIGRIEDAQLALNRNSNEFLLLVALLSRLADKVS